MRAGAVVTMCCREETFFVHERSQDAAVKRITLLREVQVCTFGSREMKQIIEMVLKTCFLP